MVCVVQRLFFAPRQESPSQRHNIFRTRCTINRKVCDVIIYSGSCENIAYKALVQALKLKSEPHPTLYKIAWIKKGAKTHVNEVCRVPFSTDKYYKDEVICDMLTWMLAMFFWDIFGFLTWKSFIKEGKTPTRLGRLTKRLC